MEEESFYSWTIIDQNRSFRGNISFYQGFYINQIKYNKRNYLYSPINTNLNVEWLLKCDLNFIPFYKILIFFFILQAKFCLWGNRSIPFFVRARMLPSWGGGSSGRQNGGRLSIWHYPQRAPRAHGVSRAWGGRKNQRIWWSNWTSQKAQHFRKYR